MRFFGLAMFFLGCLCVFAFPYMQLGFSNQFIGKYRLYDLERGHVSVSGVELKRSQIPIGVNLELSLPKGVDAPGMKSAFRLDIARTSHYRTGTTSLVDEDVSFDVHTEQRTQGNAGNTTIIKSLPAISKLWEGAFTISSSHPEWYELELETIDLVLTSRDYGDRNTFAFLGYLLMLSGAALSWAMFHHERALARGSINTGGRDDPITIKKLSQSSPSWNAHNGQPPKGRKKHGNGGVVTDVSTLKLASAAVRDCWASGTSS